jgi:hypothetical protein
MANQSGRKVPLRNWSMGSYDPVTGRSHASINEAGNPDNHSQGADNQVPSISGRDKSGSGDPGRNKSRGSSLP